jgi:acyl dehydratase
MAAASRPLEVLEVRVSRNKPLLGVLRWRWSMRNQRGDEVLDLTTTSLFDLSGRLPPPGH